MDFDTFFNVFSLLSRWEKTFPYHKDRYALMLLEYAAQDGISIAELKRGRYARLLNKPLVRQFLGRHGSSHVHADDIRAYEVPGATRYRIGFSRWPREKSKRCEDWTWQQTTRPGYNFVLQLNFPLKHNHRVRRLAGRRVRHMDPGSHPARLDREITMAWARIDLDLDHSEALIEEIQTDWIREVVDAARPGPTSASARAWKQYIDELLEPHIRQWDEAMLTAAISYLARHVGIRDIYFHTFQGGAQMKHMRTPSWQPPRSLYTKLPRRFCFQETPHAPHFIRKEKAPRVRKALEEKPVRWHVLRL